MLACVCVTQVPAPESAQGAVNVYHVTEKTVVAASYAKTKLNLEDQEKRRRLAVFVSVWTSQQVIHMK